MCDLTDTMFCCLKVFLSVFFCYNGDLTKTHFFIVFFPIYCIMLVLYDLLQFCL